MFKGLNRAQSLVSFLSILATAQTALAGTTDDEILRIQARIKARGAHWTAKKNSFSELSEAEKQKRFGTLQGVSATGSTMTTGGGTTAVTVPATLDWRNKDGMS